MDPSSSLMGPRWLIYPILSYLILSYPFKTNDLYFKNVGEKTASFVLCVTSPELRKIMFQAP